MVEWLHPAVDVPTKRTGEVAAMSGNSGKTFRWHRRNHGAEIHAAQGMTLEERGALYTIVDHICEKANNLYDDDTSLAGLLGVDKRIYRRLKARLIELGKLYIKTGDGSPNLLCSPVTDVEVPSSLAKIEAARLAGVQSAAAKQAKSRARSSRYNDLAATHAGSSVPTMARQINRENNKELSLSAEQLVQKMCVDLGSEKVDSAWKEQGRKLCMTVGAKDFEAYFVKLMVEFRIGPPALIVVDKPVWVSHMETNFREALDCVFGSGGWSLKCVGS